MTVVGGLLLLAMLPLAYGLGLLVSFAFELLLPQERAQQPAQRGRERLRVIQGGRHGR
jgi:hypothetical protein